MCDSGEGLNRVAKHTGQNVLIWSDSIFFSKSYNQFLKLTITIIEILVFKKENYLKKTQQLSIARNYSFIKSFNIGNRFRQI